MAAAGRFGFLRRKLNPSARYNSIHALRPTDRGVEAAGAVAYQGLLQVPDSDLLGHRLDLLGDCRGEAGRRQDVGRAAIQKKCCR
jgi:hypothetical protein